MKKVIHIYRRGNAEKSSYTQSYSRYPQKMMHFWGRLLNEKQTNVLLRNHKVCLKKSKTENFVDISNVKK